MCFQDENGKLRGWFYVLLFLFVLFLSLALLSKVPG
jgi:hypothetical protein